MTLFTHLYFDKNVDLDILFSDLQRITNTENVITHERLDTETQTITRKVHYSTLPTRPGISMTCAIIGKLIEEDIYDDAGEHVVEAECFVEVELYTKASMLAPVETHVGYLLALADRGYTFRWKNAFNDRLYDGNDLEALLDFCLMSELPQNK